MENSWNLEIESMINIMSDLKKADIDEIYEYNLPESPATQKQIEEVEDYLGYKLDKEYKSFLKHADGWKGFKQTIDLFGTKELLHIKEIDSVNVAFDTLLEEGVLESSGFSKSELLPIAVAQYDSDLFLMTNANSNIPGMIIWFAGYEVERYENFQRFFSAMIEYNRARVERFKNGMIGN